MSKENQLAFLLDEIVGKLDQIISNYRKELPQDILSPLDELLAYIIEHSSIIIYGNENKI